MEARLAVGKPEPLFVEPGRAGVILSRAGPENAVLRFDLLIGDAEVVAFRAFGGDAYLLEDVALPFVGEVLAFAEPPREVADNIPIQTRFVGWVYRFVVFDDTPFETGDGAFVFGPDITRQHHIGKLRRLGEKEVADDEEIQPAQGTLDGMLVGQRDHRVRADHEAGAYLITLHRGNHQCRGVAGVWQVFFFNAPDFADIFAILGVFDLALAGKLRGFLAHLAPALAVTLAGERHVTGARASHVTSRQRQVHTSDAVIYTLALMLQPARRVDHRGFGAAEEPRRRDYRFRLEAADLRYALRRILQRQLLRRFPAVRAGADEVFIYHAFANDDVQHAVEQRGIGAGAQRQEDIGRAGSRRLAGIGHNQLAATVPRFPEPARDDGKAFADVGADQHNDVGMEHVADGVGGTVNAERAFVGAGRGGHAEAAIVVAVASAESYASEFAHQVALLVGHGRAAIHRHGVVAVL